MVHESDSIQVEALVFDEWNEDHLAAHGVEQADVEEILDNSPGFFHNLPNRAGSHVMIGQNNQGRYFFIAIRPIAGVIWYPVTGWSLNRRRALRLLGGA